MNVNKCRPVGQGFPQCRPGVPNLFAISYSSQEKRSWWSKRQANAHAERSATTPTDWRPFTDVTNATEIATPASVSTATRNAASAELTAGTRMPLPMVNQWPMESYYYYYCFHCRKAQFWISGYLWRYKLRCFQNIRKLQSWFSVKHRQALLNRYNVV